MSPVRLLLMTKVARERLDCLDEGRKLAMCCVMLKRVSESQYRGIRLDLGCCHSGRQN